MIFPRKALAFAFAAAALTSAVSCGSDTQEPATAAPAFAEIQRGTVVSAVSASGTLSPLVTVQVGSQVSGNIQQLNADFNTRVKKGDVIAQIEPSLFEAKKAQAAASLRSAEAALAKAQVAVRDAKRQLKRANSLGKRDMVSESELDTAQFTYESAVVEEQAQRAKVAEAKAALQLAEVNLAHTTIYAPVDGIVISRDVDVGQTVAASLQAPTLFTIAQDLAQMQIEADVDEAFIGMVHEGQPVAFSVFAYPKRTFNGKLVQIRLNPDLEEKAVVIYKCIIHVDNSDLSLKPGMTATVSIEVDRRENVLKVRNAALRYV
ncbi:MAG: efflux RND transporter periplasmic adaptor subunit, partial [Pseudomonadota bacterium]